MRDAVIVGVVLASLIMVLFLRDWGTSLVAGLVIPATMAITFIVLRLLDESFNLMTLGGLAAAVGLVIDDAIVVVENIVLHRDAGQERAEAIRRAIAEIRVPLVGSTITPIVVFLPLALDHRRDRRVLPRAGDHGWHGAADVARARADVDAGAQPLLPRPPAFASLRSEPVEGHSPQSLERLGGVPTWLMQCYERALRIAIARPALLDRHQRPASSSRPTAAIGCSAPICCRRWTRAGSSSTTSCRQARRSPKPIGC